MPSLGKPRTRWWYELPALADEPLGPALSEALLAEEAEHGLTRDVAWAYAEAMPALLGPDPMVDVRPLSCRRGAIRAAVVNEPVALEGIHHVQTASPEVCRALGARVPSFLVDGKACLEALLEHGSAVREVVVTRCVPFEVNAPFRVTFGSTSDAFRLGLAEHFLPVARLDLPDASVWLCWDRDLARACVVQGWDTVIEGRWGPRDVAPEAEPPPWAEPGAEMAGEGWAATLLHNHLRNAPKAVAVDPAQGFCLLEVEGEGAYLDAVRAAWRAGTPLCEAKAPGNLYAALASLRFEGDEARFAWVGLERVLRLRGEQLEQLTTDHDLRDAVRRGDQKLPPGMLLDELPANVVVRSLPTHAPDEGSCRVEPGDRFVLAASGCEEILEREAGGREAWLRRLRGGSPTEVARWMRDTLIRADRTSPVVVVDAGAQVAARSPKPQADAPLTPTPRDLIERPADFHGRRVRVRGVFHHSTEVRDFADAWFRGEPPVPYGSWIVEAEGLWLHDGTGRGHMGEWKSELRGTLTPVDLSRSRPVEPHRIRVARRHVPLRSEVVLERRRLGWVHDGQRVTRLGRDGRLPLPPFPDRCRAKVTFCIGTYGHLGLLEWDLLDSEPLVPERATAAAPGPNGRFVEIEGTLAPTDSHPHLDGTLPVYTPTFSKTHWLSPELLARHRSILGSGRRVVVLGEVSHGALYAISIADASGPLDM